MATAPKSAPKVVPIDDSAADAGNARKNSMKKVLFALLVIVLATGGAAGVWYLLNAMPRPAPETRHEALRPPVYLALEPLTVNLQPEYGEQYLQAAITLQVSEQVHVDQLKLYMPLVRSRLLMLLSSKKASDINTVQGKETLQKEIIARLQEPFTPVSAPLVVTGVFFTSFVIQ